MRSNSDAFFITVLMLLPIFIAVIMLQLVFCDHTYDFSNAIPVLQLLLTDHTTRFARAVTAKVTMCNFSEGA